MSPKIPESADDTMDRISNWTQLMGSKLPHLVSSRALLCQMPCSLDGTSILIWSPFPPWIQPALHFACRWMPRAIPRRSVATSGQTADLSTSNVTDASHARLDALDVCGDQLFGHLDLDSEHQFVTLAASLDLLGSELRFRGHEAHMTNRRAAWSMVKSNPRFVANLQAGGLLLRGGRSPYRHLPDSPTSALSRRQPAPRPLRPSDRALCRGLGT